MQGDLDILLKDILVKEKNILIEFSNNNADEHLILINLLLYKGDLEIGTYTLIENGKGEGIDDFLVFY